MSKIEIKQKWWNKNKKKINLDKSKSKIEIK